MNAHSADLLRDTLEPLLPDHEVTAVPWRHEGGEWIVTVWEDGDPLLDIFEISTGWVIRKPGLGPEVGRVVNVEDIPGLVEWMKKP